MSPELAEKYDAMRAALWVLVHGTEDQNVALRSVIEKAQKEAKAPVKRG